MSTDVLPVHPLLRPGIHHRAQRLRRSHARTATWTNLGSKRLDEAGFQGVLLIMQSNGGVIIARDSRWITPAMTLLSGPAGGPVAGIVYPAVQGYRRLHHRGHGRHQLRRAL